MKRYASHFLFLPGYGYLKRYVVEMDEERHVTRIFPLTEEVEDTEWLPGVIALLPAGNVTSPDWLETGNGASPFEEERSLLTTPPPGIGEGIARLLPWLFSPFDFTLMQPVAGTRRRLLR